MLKTIIKDTVGFGLLLWIVGYVLGIVLFFLVPSSQIGWYILPIGLVFSLWILFRKIRRVALGYSMLIAVIWTLIAVVLDYFFIFLALHPVDGYYKLDVYLYYLLTFCIPFFVFLAKKLNRHIR